MTQKTQNIITTIIGSITTVIIALVAAYIPDWSPIVALIAGTLNETTNLIMEKFVK